MKKDTKRGIVVDDIPKVKVVNIVFNEETTHYSIFKQVVDGLKKAGYANKKEILDIFIENIY